MGQLSQLRRLDQLLAGMSPTSYHFYDTPETEHDKQAREFLISPSQSKVNHDAANDDHRIQQVESRMGVGV